MRKTDKTPKHFLKRSFSWDLRALYILPLHRLFYKNIIVEGKENIPDSGPVIYAPNHQNALMDPLLILHATRKQIVFLARADIFKNKILAGFLKSFKILPVYRIRDGKENLNKNDESFDMIVDILEHNMPVGIFPEAAHSNKRRLLSLKKGIPRVAFLSEEKNNFTLGVKIIPIGIYYSKYNTFRSIAHVRFGKPISVSDFKETYIENEQKGMLALRDKMLKGLQPLVIDIRNIELYDIYESIRRLYVKQLIKRFKLGQLSQINKFRAAKITIESLEKYEKSAPEAMQNLGEKVINYNTLKSKHNLSDQSIEKPKISLIRLIISMVLLLAMSPIFIYGLLNNLLVYLPPKLLVVKIKDMQFHSSVKFIWGLLILPIIYIIQFFIFYAISTSWIWAFIYLLSLPISGFAAQAYFEWASLVANDWRKLLLKNRKPNELKKLIGLHTDIVHILDTIISTDK
jgi:1-acyl-sn-glycerol-3-phosphate acyltransferase